MAEQEKSGSAATTRVFKKSSPNGKITTYLGKRDFIDSGSEVDPIDGVILVDPEYLKNRKVFVNILAAFRYGREDLDVLGLTFRKDLFTSTIQVYPPLEENRKPNTQLQVRLLRKLGSNAYPFCFKIPQNAASSVTLQPAPEDTGKPCGVDYELKSYVAESENEKPHKRNSVTLAIRKLTYAPNEQGPQPSANLQHSFLLSSGLLNIEASLDKEKFYHGEKISVYLLINNNSSKKVKKVNISVTQISDIILFSKASYKCTVAEIEPEEGMPILPNSTTFSKVYQLCPTLDENRDKRGLALDGKLKHEDTNLASSTILKLPNETDSTTETTIRENLGIVVQYKVKVKVICGMLSGGDLILELPFTLTHPKPETPPPSRPVSAAVTSSGEPAVDMNLIQLEETDNVATAEDDIIFEDFARLRLKGANDGEEADA